jgi:hypothetical protein
MDWVILRIDLCIAGDWVNFNEDWEGKQINIDPFCESKKVSEKVGSDILHLRLF